jgi:F-type H+-transporting ATPase subunit b
MIFQTIIAKAEGATHGATEVVDKGLGLNGYSIAFYLICFVIAMLILNKALFVPLGKILDDRAARINKALDEAEEIESRLANIDNQAKAIVDTAKLEARQILDEAKSSVEPVKKQVIADAENSKHDIIHNAHTEADKIVATANAQAEKEVMTIVHKAIQKASHNISVPENAQKEILASLVNSKI